MKIASTICMLTWGLTLYALPSNPTLIQGEATWTHTSDSLSFQAIGKAIVNWDQFNLAPHENLTFHQIKTGAILNRVSGGTASQILGRLNANCPIYLINPEGIYIGSSASIHTAGFIASTADLSNAVFWSDASLDFTNLGKGAIVNLGSIATSQGDILLIARSIDNQGSLQAPQGIITCTTTEMIIHPQSKQPITIRLPNGEEIGIANSGHIEALQIDFKTHSPYEKAIHHTGSIEALNVTQENGRIYLVADQGICKIDGPLIASAGHITIEADTLHLTKQAHLDVSSQDQGGSVNMSNSNCHIYADPGSQIIANATLAGNGGSIYLSADEALIFNGSAEARGGPQTGNGGEIHFSSSGAILELTQMHIDTTAANGEIGHLILDPKNITIIPNGIDPATGQTFSSDPLGSATISGATLQSALDLANVTIQANTDIIFQDEVIATTPGNALTLQAGRSIQFNGQLTLNNGNFTATINDNGAISTDRDLGLATFGTGYQSQIATQGGNITLNVGNFNAIQEGEISLSRTTLDAGGGNITIEGFARQDASNYVFGVTVDSYSLVQTDALGTITLSGAGGNGSTGNVGIHHSNAFLQTENGQIHLIGQGGGDGTDNGNVGVYLTGSISSVAGPILLDGVAGSGMHGNMGIYLSGGQINTVDGDITLNGTGGGTGALNFGIRFESQSACTATGTGTLTLSGTSGYGKNNNHGVILSGGSLSSSSGAIEVTGVGQGTVNYNYGIRIENQEQTISSETGTITLNGHNTLGDGYNAGISISTPTVAITSGYGDMQLVGITDATGTFNQGIRIESGQVLSTGTGPTAAQISCLGTGGPGTDYCNGTIVQGESSEISTIDGNITIEGTARGSGESNQPIVVDPSTQVNSTGTGTITYVEN